MPQLSSDIIERIKSNDPTLTKIYLDNENHDSSQNLSLIDALMKNTRITFLQIQNITFTDSEMLFFSRFLQSNYSIKQLILVNNHFGDNGATKISYALAFNRSLKQLTLNNNNIGPLGALKIADALTYKCLTHLSLLENDIGDIGVEALSTQNSSLTTLALGYFKLSHTALRHLSLMFERGSSITHLYLPRCEIDDIGARQVGDLLTISYLKSLGIPDNNIGPEGAIYLAEALALQPTLMQLGIRNNSIGDEGAYALAKALKQNKVLQSCSINNNKITTEGLIAFTNLLNFNTSLRELDIAENTFSYEAILEFLIKLNENINLTNLYLPSCDITPDIIAVLKENFTLVQSPFETLPAEAIRELNNHYVQTQMLKEILDPLFELLITYRIAFINPRMIQTIIKNINNLPLLSEKFKTSETMRLLDGLQLNATSPALEPLSPEHPFSQPFIDQRFQAYVIFLLDYNYSAEEKRKTQKEPVEDIHLKLESGSENHDEEDDKKSVKINNPIFNAAFMLEKINGFIVREENQHVKGFKKIARILQNDGLSEEKKCAHLQKIAKFKKGDTRLSRFFHHKVRDRSHPVEEFYHAVANYNPNDNESSAYLAELVDESDNNGSRIII